MYICIYVFRSDFGSSLHVAASGMPSGIERILCIPYTHVAARIAPSGGRQASQATTMWSIVPDQSLACDEAVVQAVLVASPTVCSLEHVDKVISVQQTWTHSSGKLRYYVKCINPDHFRCFHYSQLDQFDSQESCSAWLLSWAVHGSVVDSKAKHKEFSPSAAQLAEISAAMAAADA